MTLRAKKAVLGAELKSEPVSELSTETFADRLRALIGEGSANAFARECGIGESSLRQYLHGGVPGLDKVIQIARAKNVHVNWLATGEAPRDMQPDDTLSRLRTNEEQVGQSMSQSMTLMEAQPDMLYLPRLAVEASAGSGVIPVTEEVDGYIALRKEYLREIGVDPRFAHMLRVTGRSMAPTINDRDIVVVDTSARTIVSEGLYTIVYGDAVLIKRIQMLRDGGVNIVSDNKSEGYRDEFIPRSELHTLHIVGRVRGHFRSL